MKKSLVSVMALTMCLTSMVGCSSKVDDAVQDTNNIEVVTQENITNVVSEETTTQTVTEATKVDLKQEENKTTEVSNGKFDFEIMINGTKVKLPCKVSDLEALGFVMNADKKDNTLDENYSSSGNAYKGDYYITLSIFNNTDSALKYKDAFVDAISFYDRKIADNKISIHGGLTVGSTKDEVIRVYGESGKVYEDGDFATITYEGDSYRQKIKFQFKNNVVTEIYMDSDGEYK